MCGVTKIKHVRAGLLANALHQTTLVLTAHRIHEQARFHIPKGYFHQYSTCTPIFDPCRAVP